MRAAHQQHWDINFAAVNWLHVPVALGSMLLVFLMFARAVWRRRLDDLALLAATVIVCAARQCRDLRHDLRPA